MLKNFGCFRGEHEVDFANANSNLFAISGPTGSGKSTLLDALTWVLYGQTPRLGSTGLYQHIFSPGETDLAVVLEFEANGSEYRVSRSVRSRPSGFSPGAKLERRGPDGTWRGVPETDQIHEVQAKLVEVIGLNYAGYIRAVTLPQNEFDRFLRGNDKERRDLIKALLNIDTIEKIRALAVTELGQVRGERDKAQARVENEYPGVTPERETELAGEFEKKQEHLRTLRTSRAESAEQLKQLDRLKEAVDELAAAEQELGRLAEERESVDAARQALAQNSAAHSLVPAVKAFRARERDLQQAVKDLTRTRKSVEQAASEHEQAQEANQKAEQARAEQQPALQERLAAIERGRRDASLLAQHKVGVQLADEADDLPFDEERLAELVQLLAGARELVHLERAAKNSRDELAERQAEIEQRHDNLAKLNKQLEEIVAEGKRLRAVANEAKEVYEQARVEHAAHALRAHLHEGSECPVCQSTVETVPTGAAPVDLEGLKKAAEGAEEQVRNLLGRHSSVGEQVRAEKTAISKLEAAIRDRYQVQATKDAGELSRALEPFASYGESAAEVVRVLEAERRLQLARLAARLTAVTGGRDFDGLLEETRTRIGKLDEAVAAAGKRLQEAETRLAGAKARFEAAETVEKTARASLEEAEGDLQAALATSEFESVEAAEAAILEPAEAQRLQALVEAHDKRQRNAESRHAQAEKLLAGVTYNVEEHQRLRELVAGLEVQIDGEVAAVARLEEQLKSLRARLQQLSELRESLAGFEERLAVLSNLDRWLRSDRFEAYVLGHALEELAVNASVVLHELSEGRYELTYDDEFYVRDTWMDSFRRSVKTLSGGESFIASLALALALADTVAGRQNLGALFLDEGFGTLDAEALDAVAEVLSNLTGNGRMVGVITHVTSLTERLPARLLVSKGAQGSSLAWDA